MKEQTIKRGDGTNAPHEALTLGYRPQTSRSLEERIERAMATIAFLISEDYKEYLPLFRYLESEHQKQKQEQSTLRRALAFSKEYQNL